MNDSSNKRTVIVGLFVLLGIVFLVGGILMVGNLRNTFKSNVVVKSYFEDVSGLKKGNNIWFSGVKIGTVHSLRFYDKSQVEVSMNIETKSQQFIRKDAKVKISSDGFIGNRILIIYGGTIDAPSVEEGDTLVVESTFSNDDMINTLQWNNENILEITNDFKTISRKLATGEGTIGKLLNDDEIYSNLKNATSSLNQMVSKANVIIKNLSDFSDNLNKKGTLANELTTDTVVFNSIKETVLQLQQISDSATYLVSTLKQASENKNTSMGILIHDEESGTNLKETIKNLESSSEKLDKDLEALQHNFLLRRYFKKEAKAQKKNSGE